MWAIDKPVKSETGHSTQKPVECMKRPIENNSKPGDAVYEPFSGSGTTIIAGEAGFSDAEQKLGSLLDQFNHEIATAFNLKDRGLIVLTSCSHRGVVNAVRQAQEVSGVKKVHAIIGGFHLAPYPPEIWLKLCLP